MIKKLIESLKIKGKKRLKREDNKAPLSKIYKSRLEKEKMLKQLRGR